MKKALFVLLLLLYGMPGRAATPDNVDSTLYVYYTRCNANIREKEVLQTADTLFWLSVGKNDVRMQAAALSMIAGHYYHTNNLDSLKAWLPRVQRFARQNDQLKYYYFTWNQLALYYIKRSQYTLAQYELQRILEQAEKDDYKPGIAQAYQQMGHVFSTKGLYRASADSYCKAIEYIEKNAQEYYSRLQLHMQLFDAYILLESYDEAEAVLEEARKYITLPTQENEIKVREARILAHQLKFSEAVQKLRTIEAENSSGIMRDQLREAWTQVYLLQKSYPQALQLIDQAIAEHRRLGVDEVYYGVRFNTRARILAIQGDFQGAYKNLSRYIELYKQTAEADGEQSLSEFATLLDVARLDREKTELEQQAQADKLHRTYLIITALGCIILLATIFILALVRMNRRLAHAKRAAEQSDRMKGIFIRNITHEINTPLNAIVGFSELASTTRDNEDPEKEYERRSYIHIIQENSGHLQKLINDVLYISDIESTDSVPALSEVDINACCRNCIKNLPPIPDKKLTVHFEPGQEHLTAFTSRQYVSKVLSELLCNAIRFTREGSVTLTYSVDKAGGGKLIFSVTDTGPGIPAAESDRIFERFVKLDSFSQGLGLGLGVCDLIARTMQGDIRLDTSYTGGARFLFTIPTLHP